jgi:hypothetical protein
MRTTDRLTLTLCIVATVAVVSATMSVRLGAQAGADVTGQWLFSVTTDAGSGTPTITFKQAGEKLTGHYSSATLGEAELTGTVKGTAIEFSFEANVQGNALTVRYKGTIEGKDAMKGSVDLGGAASGTFTAKRQ